MKKEWSKNTVTHMEPNEIALYRLYRAQVANGGCTRDNLPYSSALTDLAATYAQQTGQQLSEGEFWHLLKSVLKCGERQIDAYLTSLRSTSLVGTN